MLIFRIERIADGCGPFERALWRTDGPKSPVETTAMPTPPGDPYVWMVSTKFIRQSYNCGPDVPKGWVCGFQCPVLMLEWSNIKYDVPHEVRRLWHVGLYQTHEEYHVHLRQVVFDKSKARFRGGIPLSEVQWPSDKRKARDHMVLGFTTVVPMSDTIGRLAAKTEISFSPTVAF